MFESVRKKRKNPIINFIGWSLIVFVCIVFIFIGYDFNSGALSGQGAVAEVNGVPISPLELKQRVENYQRSQGPKGAQQDSKEIRRQALENLISSQLILQEAEKQNIYVSDDEVAEFLFKLPYLQEGGVFSKIRYKQFLAQQRMSEAQFENRVRDSLSITKTIGLVDLVVGETPLMSEFEGQIDKAKINISYLAFNKFNSKSVGVAKPEEVKSFLAEKKGQAEKYYKLNTGDYLQKQQVKARHILFKVDKNDEESSSEVALKKAKELVPNLTAKNFAEMAKVHSEGPSKDRGGDLGFFEREKMVAEFSKAAFTQEIGSVGPPVKTNFGYHIILVEDKKPQKQQSFEEVQEAIAGTLIQESRFKNLVESMEASLKAGDMAKIDQIAKDNSLGWKDTGLFSITDDFVPGVGRVEPFMNAAMELTKERPRSQNLLKHMNNRYILKLKEAKIDESAAKKKNPQFDFMKKFLEEQKANLALQKWVDRLRTKAKVNINASQFQ